MTYITRRDFLKASAALAASAAFAGASKMLSGARSGSSDKPNILIFVFDAMSANNLSLYGYPRPTTPNLEKFAERATVYHQHYSAGNFTTSGTASMLTGLYPWTHRAINYRGLIERNLTDHNFFHLLGNEYTRLAFTQNLWADMLLSQFENDIDIHLPSESFSDFAEALMQPDVLKKDRDLAYFVFQDFLNLRVDDPHPYPGSLFVASADLSRALTTDRHHTSADYPRGLPTNHDFSYRNTSVLDQISQIIQSERLQSSPHVAYFHLWSPHEPYNPRKKFIGRFPELLDLKSKPRHPFASNDLSDERLQFFRRQYDEFIADLDDIFGQTLAELDRAGILENSYVIVTSDHGESFERGEQGHASALMYVPVTHIPLLISAPGKQTHSDVHAPTSNLDLLPTLLQIAGREIPDWAEGQVLPGFGEEKSEERTLFAMVAKDNPAFRPIRQATFSLIRDGRELIYYTGYHSHPDLFEMYDLRADPQELRDLFSSDITTASHLKDELLEALNASNRSYQKK